MKDLKKIDDLIYKNRNFIKSILVSELFLNQIMQVADQIDVEIREIEEIEVLYLFDKPVEVSKFIHTGCILILENDEYVVLEGIGKDKNKLKGLFDFIKKLFQDNNK